MSEGTGLAISRAFFENWGRPFLEAEYPGLLEVSAAGRFSGSDVLGADDEISKNHGWGPTFALYLPRKTYAEVGAALSKRINAAAPREFLGTSLRGPFDERVSVRELETFFPATDACSFKTWLCSCLRIETMDSFLYFLRHGALFHDGLGEFARLRAVVHYYPEQVELARLSDSCFRIADFGEYNFVRRLAHRKAPLQRLMAIGSFAETVMRLSFLLNHDYSPYWKWLPYEFRKLDVANILQPQLDLLSEATSPTAQADIVEHICEVLGEQLRSRGFLNQPVENPFKIPWFLLFASHFRNRISDPEVCPLAFGVFR